MAKISVEHIRQAAETDFISFVRLVAPHRVIPHFQEDLMHWMTRSDAKSHQLILLPRDHAKSTIIAYRVTWEIVRDPTIRVLYISSTANLAEKQLGLIKQILTSRSVQRYWPDLVNPEEGLREKWTASEISVDDPRRKKEAIRDPTVFTGGLTTSLTGLHCDIAVLDDVVVQENAYTEDGREKVKGQYSLLASIEAADAREWVVGTRYHPLDLYADLVSMEHEIYDNDGELKESDSVYEVFQRVVEQDGVFLWPRQQRTTDGKWFGFDSAILSKKRAQYLDKTQFYAQYYNDPNKNDAAIISADHFQYYDRNHVKHKDGAWYVQGKKVNVFAAMDFAFSLGKRSDFSAIVVVGVDASGNIFVLDIDRFKTELISVLYDHMKIMWSKWKFRKIRMEMTVAQATIVREIRENYIKPDGVSVTIDEYYPTRKEGDKPERMAAVLGPRYQNRSVWHFRGGHCQTLEEELILLYPQHDDVKDALTNAVVIAKPPTERSDRSSGMVPVSQVRNSRFGGV